MVLLDLEDDILLQLLQLLSIQEIAALRQVCVALHRLAHTRAPWISRISLLVSNGAHIPEYLANYREMDADSLEAFARRLSFSTDKWAAGNLAPARTYPLFLAQSVTWLRLVHGQWLFVASSDDRVSKITCWDVSRVLSRSDAHVAEAYLPSQVKTAHLEVQHGAVVIALGLGPEARSTHLVSLRRCGNDLCFVELAIVADSAHVLMLSGEYIGCGVRHSRNYPHVVRWTTGEILDLPPPPGRNDEPGLRSVPHLMLFWHEMMVVVRESGLETYDFRSQSRPAFTFKGAMACEHIWEVHRLPADESGSLRLAILSSRGIEILGISSNVGFGVDHCLPVPLFPQSSRRCWHRLHVGANTALWLGTVEPDEIGYEHPHMLVGSLRSPAGSETEAFECRIWRGFRSRTDPALWGLPLLDFDEALGLIVLGNCFGELAIYDLCGGPLFDTRIPENTQRPVAPKLLAQSPLPMNLAPRGPTQRMPQAEFQAATSLWGQDIESLGLNGHWSSDWFAQRWFTKAFMWNAAPGGLAWCIEHAYGFPGTVLPQAFTTSEYSDDASAIIFRVGDRVLIRNLEDEIGSWSHEAVAEGLYIDTEDVQRPTCETALVASSAFTLALHAEGFKLHEGCYAQTPRRNRYAEQRARGGSVHWDEFPII